jgi:ubiquinone/menaquinone biosynthesis C-methylase UbiE/uncharacterized protein YbaR (Trm112 family)
MKPEILTLLTCPKCKAGLHLTPFHVENGEVRSGVLSCSGKKQHLFDIEDGIIRFATGFDHDAVKRELEYENTTYKGSDRLRDPRLIAGFPDTLAELWPHTANFGPDFRVLIDHLKLKPSAWVLDVGTGPCWSSRLLAQRGFNVIALDVNEADFYGLKTSDILFQCYNIYFDRILESMTHLPFQNETLDAITFNASFHHTPDMEKTLDECLRVLKPGGVIAMVNEEFSSIRQKFFNNEEATDTGSHHTIAYSDFEQAIQKRGFSIQYFVAHHVRKQLEKKLSPALGEMAVKAIERFPLSLKQLNSALIILTKPRTVKRTIAKPQQETVDA